jgi:hypothetical protein
MQNKTNINISYSEEEENEEDDNPIITNNDEFGTVNDLPSKPNNKSICNLNKLEHHRAKSKKLNDEFKINTPIAKFGTPHMNLYSLLLQGDDNISLENKNKLKKWKIKQKKQNSKIKKYLDVSKKNGKSVFIKISEDIYTKFKSKPNKEVRDINKMEEDAYNKMTSDPYIQTCENRENLKNRKIVQDFLHRKAKEDTFKKIGIECDRNMEMKKLQDPKRAFSVTDRNINFKSTRTLAQFLQDQNQKNNNERKNKNSKKIPLPVKGNILPQDSTYIFSENKKDDLYSEFSNDFDIYNFDNISMQYDNVSLLQGNNKYIDNNEKEKIVNKTFELEKELIDPAINFSLINTKNRNKKQELTIKEKTNKTEPKKMQNLKKNEKKEKKDKNKKESSSTSTSKKSTDNISKKLINIYKEVLSNNFNKKIENDFDINYSAFLLILYKVGFTNKNYSNYIEASELNIDKKSMHSKDNSDYSLSNSNLNMSQLSNKKNTKNLNKDSISGKSLEDEAEKYKNAFKYDKEFQLSKDAWKIITEKQNFDEDIGISSKKLFLFYISVLGLCKDEKNDVFMKKECSFFFNDKKLVQQFNNVNKYIYKYFALYKINAMDNLLVPEKRNEILNNNGSIFSSFTVSNLDNSSNNNNYDIYEKQYNNKKNNLLNDSNSIRLFNSGIKNENLFYNKNNNNLNNLNNLKDGSNKSILSLTDIDHADDNSIFLLNNSMTDNSSFSDIKRILRDNPLEQKEDESDELEVDSFLLEDNQNYFQYGPPPDKNRNNYSEIKSYIQDDEEGGGKKNKEKKKIKYVFEIKIEDESKKLIIKKEDDKNTIIKNFCKKYGLDDIEKNKIIKVIDEQLKKLNSKIRKNS